MANLCKTSSADELKQYFAGVMTLAKSNEQFPVNLDDVWPLVYTQKSHAVRDLKKNGMFFENIDYIVKKGDETILSNFGQNKSEEDETIFPKIEENKTTGKKEVLSNFGQNPIEGKEVFPKFEENPTTENEKDLGGRPVENYFLSLSCLEFFIARKVRAVFEVYRKVFHYATLKTDNYLLSVVPETHYNLTTEATLDDIAGFLRDMYTKEQYGDLFPIFLPEVFALYFPTMGAAIDELLHHPYGYQDGKDYIRKDDGAQTGYYLSFSGFNQLIACRSTLVVRAYESVVATGFIPEMPHLLQSEKQLSKLKAPKRMMKIRSISGTKKEQSAEIVDRVMALLCQSEYIEEMNTLNEVLNGMVRYKNFIDAIEEAD